MKITTKAGDQGFSSLLSQSKIPKYDTRFALLGDLDECACSLGILVKLLSVSVQNSSFTKAQKQQLIQLKKPLTQMQLDWFWLGAELAQLKTSSSVTESLKDPHWMSESHITELETALDGWSNELPPLQNFILPGGWDASMASAQAHLTRALCRRMERTLVATSQEFEIRPILLKYMNRLSDYFFGLARWISFCEKAPETIWNPKKR